MPLPAFPLRIPASLPASPYTLTTALSLIPSTAPRLTRRRKRTHGSGGRSGRTGDRQVPRGGVGDQASRLESEAGCGGGLELEPEPRFVPAAAGAAAGSSGGTTAAGTLEVASEEEDVAVVVAEDIARALPPPPVPLTTEEALSALHTANYESSSSGPRKRQSSWRGRGVGRARLLRAQTVRLLAESHHAPTLAL